MTWIADGAPCTYLDLPDRAFGLVAVGWLGAGQPFTTGRTDLGVRDRLAALLADPFAPPGYRGWHECDLPHPQEEPGPFCGLRNLVVPGPGVLFACPELITHYVDRHAYAPPSEFCAAVLACPDPFSVDYFLALLRAGGEVWLEFLPRPRPADLRITTYGPDAERALAADLARWDRVAAAAREATERWRATPAPRGSP